MRSRWREKRKQERGEKEAKGSENKVVKRRNQEIAQSGHDAILGESF